MWLNWASKHGTHMVEALAQQPKMNGRIKKNLARMCKKTLKSHCHTVGNSFESCCCRIQSYRWPHQKGCFVRAVPRTFRWHWVAEMKSAAKRQRAREGTRGRISKGRMVVASSHRRRAHTRVVHSTRRVFSRLRSH